MAKTALDQYYEELVETANDYLRRVYAGQDVGLGAAEAGRWFSRTVTEGEEPAFTGFVDPGPYINPAPYIPATPAPTHCPCGAELMGHLAKNVNLKCGDCCGEYFKPKHANLDTRIKAAAKPDADPTSEYGAWASPTWES